METIKLKWNNCHDRFDTFPSRKKFPIKKIQSKKYIQRAIGDGEKGAHKHVHLRSF